METISTAQLPAVFESVAAEMAARAQELGELDARMGDGDLGLTMKKGFAALPDILRAVAEQETDIGRVLAKAGMKLAGVVPSTMGTLMASGLMGGGKAVTGSDALDASGFALFLAGFADGVAKRGKCAPGDRTVLDALAPAADGAALAAAKGGSLAETAKAAAQAARAGVEETKAMRPKYGKAAVFAGRAAGVPDQGACAALYLLIGLSRGIESL